MKYEHCRQHLELYTGHAGDVSLKSVRSQSGCWNWACEEQSGLPGHCAEWMVMMMVMMMMTGELPPLKVFLM